MKKLYDGIIDMHNHTIFSDGDCTVDELLINAYKRNIKVLGISDHYEEIELFYDYEKKLIERSFSNVILKKGIEIRCATIKKLSESEINSLYRLDYILIEDCEFCPSLIELFSALEKLSSMKVLLGLAHLDLSVIQKRFGKEGLILLLQYMQNNNIFWEVNSDQSNEFYDLLLYDRADFREIISFIKSFNINISVGSDTHYLDETSYPRLIRANNFVDNLIRPQKYST